jgi:prevent-host-death family protein
MKKVALSEVKDDLSRFLRLAEKEELVITRHGKAAGVLIGFESEDDWFDYRLENDPRFLHRVEVARESLRAGQGVRLEDVGAAGGPVPNKALQRAGSRVTAPAEKRKRRATRSRR